jgi:hypothetical protein
MNVRLLPVPLIRLQLLSREAKEGCWGWLILNFGYPFLLTAVCSQNPHTAKAAIFNES